MLNRLLKDRWGYLIRRLFAFGFDWYFCAVLCNILSYGVEALIQPANDAGKLGVLALSAIIGSFIYFIIVPTFVFNGQSLMMRAMQVKCVTIDNEPLSFKTVIYRFIIGCMLIEGSFYFVTTVLQSVILIMVFPDPRTADMIIGSIFMISSVCSIIYAFFDIKETRLFHDLIAKTKVIDLRKIS